MLRRNLAWTETLQLQSFDGPLFKKGSGVYFPEKVDYGKNIALLSYCLGSRVHEAQTRACETGDHRLYTYSAGHRYGQAFHQRTVV